MLTNCWSTNSFRFAACALFVVALGCQGASLNAPPANDAGLPDNTGREDAGNPNNEEPVDDGAVLARGEVIFRDYCISCHTIGGGDYRGPDLMHAALNVPTRWMRNWLSDPETWRQNNPRAANISAQWKLDMPNPGLMGAEIDAVIAFLRAQALKGSLASRPPVVLSPEAFEESVSLYFNRCAGCHGTSRAGATGPNIGQERATLLGTDTVAAVIRHGTPSGMPAMGTTNILTESQILDLAAFLQLDPPEAPRLSMEEIRESWKLHVAVADRPLAPAHERDWRNFFGVVLRDSGLVVVFDGDTKEELVRIDTGFAVHILRSSATGRYFYAVGRDGRVTLIDLWSSVPTAVAEARGCYDARSVEGSKFAGYEDRFLIEGCYWPNQYVVFDGLTLEPLHRADIEQTACDTGEALDEVRVAVIAASYHESIWTLALKESGHVAVVDYSEPGFPMVDAIAAERFLHDGGWDHRGRYFLVAANARDQMIAFDTVTRAVVGKFETGQTPHPGRGANWLDPEYGWVNATVHMGEGLLAVYGADPEARPDVAWQVVREVALPSAGSLFLKTHPESPWVLVDFPLSQDPLIARQVCAYSKASGGLDRCWTVSQQGPPVHFEFNRDGSELWISVWDPQGAIVIHDSTTLEELRRLEGLATPTGKFNVFNTANDVY